MHLTFRNSLNKVFGQPDQAFSAKSFFALFKWLFVIVLAAYLYQGIVPAFNQDDIVQLTTPKDSENMLAQGRWGYYFIFVWLQDANGWPLISTLIGCAFLVLTHLIAAHHLGFSRTTAVIAFVSVASVSVYYANAFDFDSTRVAYPLANLLAATGVYLLGQRRYFPGVALLAIAPALYPAATQFAGALWLCGIILGIMQAREQVSWKKALIEITLLLGALIVYMLLTKLSAVALGYKLNNRSAVSLYAAIANFPTIKATFATHAIPFLSGIRDHYHTVAMSWASGLLSVGFLIYAVKRCIDARSILRLLGVLIFFVALLFSPFGLMFASVTDYYPSRSLYTYALIFAFFAATLIDDGIGPDHINGYALIRPTGAAVLSLFLVVANMAQISRVAFDHYLQSKVDFLETSRIITAIDNVIADTPLATATEIPLVVVYDQRRPSPVRGHVQTGAHPEWSKEIIYSFLDARFKPTAAITERQLDALKGRPVYPAAGSIFIDGDTVVVLRDTSLHQMPK